MRCFPKVRRGTARSDFANIFIPLETRGTSPLPSETDESKRILAPPECICCRAMALLDARSIGKAAQSVKQKQLKSMKSAPKRIFERRAYEWTAVPNRESKASAYLGSDGAVRGGPQL